jgi:cytochrome b involved in lipid metabolism
MTTVFTLAEVEKHKGSGDCWLIIHDKVWDVSLFVLAMAES